MAGGRETQQPDRSQQGEDRDPAAAAQRVRSKHETDALGTGIEPDPAKYAFDTNDRLRLTIDLAAPSGKEGVVQDEQSNPHRH